MFTTLFVTWLYCIIIWKINTHWQHRSTDGFWVWFLVYFTLFAFLIHKKSQYIYAHSVGDNTSSVIEKFSLLTLSHCVLFPLFSEGNNFFKINANITKRFNAENEKKIESALCICFWNDSRAFLGELELTYVANQSKLMFLDRMYNRYIQNCDRWNYDRPRITHQMIVFPDFTINLLNANNSMEL